MAKVVTVDKVQNVVAEQAPTPTAVKQDVATPERRKSEIKFKLPDGRIVAVGPPLIPSDVLLPALMATPENSKNVIGAMYSEQLARNMIFVRSIDGHPTVVLDDPHKVVSLANQLGDYGVEAVKIKIAKHYPGIKDEDLPEIPN